MIPESRLGRTRSSSLIFKNTLNTRLVFFILLLLRLSSTDIGAVNISPYLVRDAGTQEKTWRVQRRSL